MADTQTTGSRPLSPHLQIYKPLFTMVMSIMHRITGGALYFGTALVVWWLVAAASGPASYDFAAGILGSWLGLLVLFGYTWALMHHMLGGVRHFIWDTGAMLDVPSAQKLAKLTLAGSLASTVLIWLIGLTVF